MYKKLLTKIKEYKNICIYRHVRPDGDACFSQFALAQFIKDNFKGKHVEICGELEYDLLPYSNTADDNLVSKSLVIVLDTSNASRVDGSNYALGEYIIKIDHHPRVDDYADLSFVDDKAASTTELLADIFYSKDFRQYKLSQKTCIYLYCGILTDSNSFSTSSTTARTLLLASKLVEDGKFDVSALSNYLFSTDLERFKNISLLRNELIVEDNIAYIIANKKLLSKLKMTSDDAKNAIDEFNHIKGVRIWAIFAQNAKTGLFDASIRSNKKYIINTTCLKYNGGGHKNACGIKNLDNKSLKLLINDLKKIAKK